MESSFYNRIDYKGSIENIFIKVCEDFELGSYVSYELVPFGYEDFNVVLNTTKSTYFVKIFGSFRDREQSKQYVKIMELVYKNKIHYPFLYECSKGHLYEINLDNTQIRLVVQQFIVGKNFIELGAKPTQEEKQFIVQQAVLINALDFKPRPVYDSWAVVNFNKEFKKRGMHLSKNLQATMQTVLDEFLKITPGKLPHCFVHGDMISSNIMKDKQGKIYILDFAVSNYYPRIVELASLICFNFFDPGNSKTLQKAFDFTLETYQKFTHLEDIEIKTLPIFIKATFAMYLLRSNFEKVVNENTSEENEHWLRVGNAGLLSSF